MRNFTTSYTKLSEEQKKIAEIIYKENMQGKKYPRIIEDHPEFTFSSRERARQLCLAYKNHLVGIKSLESRREK